MFDSESYTDVIYYKVSEILGVSPTNIFLPM